MMRLAVADDWPTIAAWRAAHHARMSARNGLPIAAGAGAALDSAVWVVLEERFELLAALSFFDSPPLRRLCDLYWAPGFAGKRAAYTLAGNVLEFAEHLNLEPHGDTNISNYEYRAILRRLGFRAYYYEFERDVCHFRRDDTQKGFRYVGKFKSDYANQPKPGRPRLAAAANSAADSYGATS